MGIAVSSYFNGLFQFLMDVRPSESFCTNFSGLIRNGKHRFTQRQCQPHRDGIADLAVFRCACPHELPIIRELLDAGILTDAQGSDIMVAFCTGDVTNVGDGWLYDSRR